MITINGGIRRRHSCNTCRKSFALLIIPVGVGIVTYAIGVVAAMIIEGNLFHAVRRKKMDKQIAQLQNHIIVCGCGK